LDQATKARRSPGGVSMEETMTLRAPAICDTGRIDEYRA